MGDLNINIQKDGCRRKQLLYDANMYLTMTINKPTHVTESAATITDQIITDMPGKRYSNQWLLIYRIR
jgi:hypothetical protein